MTDQPTPRPSGRTAVPMKWRTCNCTDLWLPDGIIRSLLEVINPSWKYVNKQPCQHWIEGSMTPLNQPEKSGKDGGK